MTHEYIEPAEVEDEIEDADLDSEGEEPTEYNPEQPQPESGLQDEEV